MELDFSSEWRIIGPSESGPAEGPGAFAAGELASTLVRMGCRPPTLGAGVEGAPLIVLHQGKARPDPASARRGVASFSWRASPSYVEIYGEDGGSLLRGAYDFLEALGARWIEPGAGGERLPQGPVLAIAEASRHSDSGALATTLILGHGAFLERWEDYLPWAARAGYTSVFIHTSPDALAMGAAPASLYESLRPSIAAAARNLGLRLELGGHGLSAFLPRALFEDEPELFRERGGLRVGDRNFCSSSPRALSLASAAFAEMAAAHPEISVFHAWPDDLPGGGWCSCPLCASLSPASQSLAAARGLALALASSRPDASVSYLAYHDTENIAAVLESAAPSEHLPSNLELLWAPRLRSWAVPLGAHNSLNDDSLSAFRRTSRAWRAAGGGRVAVFEYWEDAVLFKSAVPPLSAVMEGDVAAYGQGPSEETADTIGILCTGGRLPLAPRPNLYLLPRLAAKRGLEPAARILADWASAAYGPAAPAMLEYWRELEAAWAIDLDLESGDSAVLMPQDSSRFASEPPADWGDPWKASVERLAAKRDRCEELFDHLRLAEARLSEAKNEIPEDIFMKERLAVSRESSEYGISGSVLELDCARLAAYHELASGDGRAAADIANLALSASDALRKAFKRLPDRRERREMGLLIGLYYDLRLRSIRRANARSGLRRLLDLWFTTARTALSAAAATRAYEPKSIASPSPRH